MSATEVDVITPVSEVSPVVHEALPKYDATFHLDEGLAQDDPDNYLVVHELLGRGHLLNAYEVSIIARASCFVFSVSSYPLISFVSSSQDVSRVYRRKFTMEEPSIRFFFLPFLLVSSLTVIKNVFFSSPSSFRLLHRRRWRTR